MLISTAGISAACTIFGSKLIATVVGVGLVAAGVDVDLTAGLDTGLATGLTAAGLIIAGIACDATNLVMLEIVAVALTIEPTVLSRLV